MQREPSYYKMAHSHMPAGPSTANEELKARALAARAQFVASGTNVSDWARQRGFPIRLVHQILRGERRCIRGESHRAAVALGIKDDVPPPGPRTRSAGTGASMAPVR